MLHTPIHVPVNGQNCPVECGLAGMLRDSLLAKESVSPANRGNKLDLLLYCRWQLTRSWLI